MRVLTLNAGSSTLKASLIENDEAIAQATLGWVAGGRELTVRAALEALEVDIGTLDAVAHRIVHGGESLTVPVVVDDTVIGAIAAVGELAPLHNDVALETLHGARSMLADLPHVACFDTAFHAGMADVATRYPVPAAWRTRWGIRRFGFHGLSIEWAIGRASTLLARERDELGLIVAHLGSGCSVTSVWSGRSAWTSMGFTPLDGLMMRTRSGAIDPGIIVHLLRHRHLDVDELASDLERGSGLVGVGGHGGDVRELEAAAASGDEEARLALDMFASRAAAGIAAAATWLERLHGIVFTGGIGEHAGRLRARIIDRLQALDVAGVAQTETGRDRILSDGRVKTLRIEAREDLVMARAAGRLLAATPD